MKLSYDGMIADIQQIIEWLEGANEDEWEYRIGVAESLRADLEGISTPRPRPDKTGTRSTDAPVFAYESKKASDATPLIRSMISAMTLRQRDRAIESGKGALAILKSRAV